MIPTVAQRDAPSLSSPTGSPTAAQPASVPTAPGATGQGLPSSASPPEGEASTCSQPTTEPKPTITYAHIASGSARAKSTTPSSSKAARGIVVKHGGQGGKGGSGRWLLLRSLSYGKNSIFVYRGSTQDRLRPGTSVFFHPTGKDVTLGGTTLPGATAPSVCKRHSSNDLDWYPGTLQRNHTGGSSSLKIEFAFPADNTRGSPTRKSHFDLPAGFKPNLKPGTPVRFQATLNAEGAVTLMPNCLRPDASALRTITPCQIHPALLRSARGPAVILGGLAPASLRLPNQASLEDLFAKYAGSVNKFDLLDAAYRLLSAPATPAQPPAGSPCPPQRPAPAFDPDGTSPIQVWVLSEGINIPAWHECINRCYTKTSAPRSFVTRAKIRLVFPTDPLSTPAALPSTVPLDFAHDQSRYFNHASGLELEEGVTQLFRQTRGSSANGTPNYAPTSSPSRLVHLLYDSSTHSSYEGATGVPGMLHLACSPAKYFSNHGPPPSGTGSAASPGSAAPTVAADAAGPMEVDDGLPAVAPAEVRLEPTRPDKLDGILVSFPKAANLLPALADAVQFASSGQAHLRPFHIPSGDLAGVLLTRMGGNSRDFAAALNSMGPATKEQRANPALRFHAMTLGAYLSPDNVCLWAGDGHRIPIEALRSLFGGAQCIQNGNRSWLLHAPGFSPAAITAGLRAFNTSMMDAAAKDPTTSLTPRQLPIKAFTLNHTVTWLTPTRPQPSNHQAWAALNNAAPTTSSANTRILHGVPAGTAPDDINAILNALKVDPARAFWYQTKGGYTGIEVDLPDAYTPPPTPVYLGFCLVSLAPAPAAPRQRLHPVNDAAPPTSAILARLRERLTALHASAPRPDAQTPQRAEGPDAAAAAAPSPNVSTRAAEAGRKAMTTARDEAKKTATTAKNKEALASARHEPVHASNPLSPAPKVPVKKGAAARAQPRGSNGTEARQGQTATPLAAAVAVPSPGSSPGSTGSGTGTAAATATEAGVKHGAGRSGHSRARGVTPSRSSTKAVR